MLEVTSKGTLDSTYVKGDFQQFIAELNVAAAGGKHFIAVTEIIDGEESPVALETTNITRVRAARLEDEPFIGR